MKPCLVCKQPKTYHTDVFDPRYNHEFKMDNLAYLERNLKLKEAREKAHKLNFCLICKNIRKSPFGICQECSTRLITEKTIEEILSKSVL